MSKKLLRKKLALMLATLKKKRKYYCEVEYLEGTGTQYIDTGYIPNTNTECSMDFMFTTIDNAYRTPLSVRTADGAANSFTIATTTRSLLNFAFGTKYWDATTSPQTNIYYSATLNSVRGTLNNLTGNINSTITPTTLTAYMFARNANGTAANFFIGRIYDCQLKDNGTLIRDFIPVLDWDMTPCMYDRVTEQLFYNQGTGDFIAGRQIHPVEYLESTGTQYINTGIKSSYNLDVKIDFEVPTFSGEQRIFGQSDVTYVYRFGYTASSIFVSNGSDYPYSTTVTSGNRYLLELNGKDFYVDGVLARTMSNVPIGSADCYLFAWNRSPLLAGVMKCYSCQIEENSVLVRDYKPAIDENGVGFLFDKVSHTIYDNAGTGAFSYPAREVEYLESTGEQYIDTGYSFNSNTDEIELYYQNTSTQTHKWLFGAYESNANIGISSATITAPTFWYKGNISSKESAQYNSKHILRYDSTGMSNDGVNLKAFTSYTGTWNLYLFALNNTGTSPNGYFGYGKIWGYKHIRNGSIVLDLIPAFKDGSAGMWDKANNVFYSNIGTGAFTTSKIIEPEYE